MFAKLKIALRKKMYPCEQILNRILDDHADALNRNVQARERLQNACQIGKVSHNATVKAQAQR